QVVEAHARSYDKRIDPILEDCSLSPLARLRGVFEFLIADFTDRGLRYGCLIGNLSQEMADQSDAFRVCLDEIVDGWHRSFTSCLQEAQEMGQLPKSLDSAKFASFCLDSWEGAVLRAKLSKSATPLEDFVSIVFEVLLVEQASVMSVS
ncbi:MAG: TetR family transcriptional regulator C-terminal domain-containing protein, partial [Cyanobacteria bacterium J06641_5]